MTSARRRIVVTGVGMITPLGATVDKTWEGIVAGRSGVGPITRFDPTSNGASAYRELAKEVLDRWRQGVPEGPAHAG